MALAHARGLDAKHAIKQIDRFLSNQGIDPWELAATWVPYLVLPMLARVIGTRGPPEIAPLAGYTASVV